MSKITPAHHEGVDNLSPADRPAIVYGQNKYCLNCSEPRESGVLQRQGRTITQFDTHLVITDADLLSLAHRATANQAPASCPMGSIQCLRRVFAIDTETCPESGATV